MPVTLMRHAPRIGNVLLNTAAVVALGVSTSSIWASGTITTPSGSSIAGVGGDVEWSLTEFSVGNGAAKEKWRDVFTYFDEGTNACNRLFVSGGGVAGSTQSPAVPVSIDGCTTAKGVFDQVDTAQRLVFLALALAGFGVLTMLSVAALSSQENGSDLWLPGLYSVVATVLGFTLAVSAVSVFQTAVTAATGDSDEVWVTLAVFFAGNSAGATSLDGNDISGSTVALDTQGGFAAGAIAAAFLAVSSLLSVYELWMIKREADAEEAEKERQAQALKDKKADLAAKNRAAAEAQAQRVSELQAGSSGAAAEGKKDA